MKTKIGLYPLLALVVLVLASLACGSDTTGSKTATPKPAAQPAAAAPAATSAIAEEKAAPAPTSPAATKTTAPASTARPTDTPRATNTPKPTNTSRPSPTANVGGVGERREAGGIALTITKVSKTNTISDLWKAKAGHVYLVVEALIENTTRDEAPYNPLYFKVKDEEGYEYTTALAAPSPDLKSGSLAKGERVRGNVAFEVPTAAKGFVLSYEPMVILGGYQPIRIGLDATQRDAARQEATPAVSAGASTKVISPGNLRAGPGTNYSVIGSVKAGDVLGVSGRNSDGSWLLVTPSGGEAWIFAQLVEPVSAASLPVKTSTAPTAVPVVQPTAAPAAQFNAGGFPKIGQEVEGGGWRFKVLETHKRKAVYFYDTAYIAQGHFLVLIIEAVNLQPGTNYFAKNVDLYLTDAPGKAYSSSSKGSSYAAWQYTKDSVYDDTNPGVVSRMAIAFDLPDNLGDVLVSTGKLLKWIYLGNFAQMKSEDS